MTREFKDTFAVREQVPNIVGLIGPSGSGKTGSALELLTGFQDISGGDIGVIDSEARRALSYADAPMFSEPTRKFKFRHLDFKAPFGPSDYMAAVAHFVKAGVKHIAVDSTTHMHEGPGGTLETHQAEVERLMKAWSCNGDKANFPAWHKPKSEVTQFINYIKQQNVNFVFCFRAKEKLKMVNNKPVPSGWQPIGSEELIYEMTLACLLLPECDGQPIWNKSEEKGVKALHSQFRPLFASNPRLSAEVGRQLATWAAGKPLEPAKTAAATAPKAAAVPQPAQAPADAPMRDFLDVCADMRKATSLGTVKTLFIAAEKHKSSYPAGGWDSILATKDEMKEHFSNQQGA